MNKIRILVIAVLVIAFCALTGCSSDDGNVADDNTQPNALPTSPAAPTDDTSGGLLSTESPNARSPLPGDGTTAQ